MSSGHTSDIQQKIFQFIVAYSREQGMPPTNREIGGATKNASTGHVDYHLHALEKKNLNRAEYKKNSGTKHVRPAFCIHAKCPMYAGAGGGRSGRYRAKEWRSSANARLLNLF